MFNPLSLLPTKTKLYAIAAAVIAAVAAWLRFDARRDARREDALKQKEKEHEITEDMGLARDDVRRDGVRKRLRDGEF